MPKIVVPTDFSQTAASALRYATYLADLTGYELEVVHFHDGYGKGGGLITMKGNLSGRMEAQRNLDDFIRFNVDPVKFSEEERGAVLPTVKTRAVIGAPPQGLIAISREPETTLIVMGGVGAGLGTKGPTLFGSVARAAAMQAACPVMLIPRNYGVPVITTVAYAYNKVTPLKLMHEGASFLMSVLRPTTRFVHVKVKDQEKEMERELALLEEVIYNGFPGHPVDLRELAPGPLLDQLEDFLYRSDVDLLVVGRRKRSKFEQLFIGSEISPLLTDCMVPLLVIPIEKY